MKKIMILLMMCGVLTGLVSGCADIAESWSEETIDGVEEAAGAQVAENAALIEEGYFVVQGKLIELTKSELLLETEDGQTLYFELAPETIVYTGENKELLEGQNIQVVFDGDMAEEEIENISVIAVTIYEE